MTVFRALPKSESVSTGSGFKRITHEAFSYHITPFSNPPIVLESVKGGIGPDGAFIPVPETLKRLPLTPAEYQSLLKPNVQGKPSGDFRLSDILSTVEARNKPKDAPAAPAAAPASVDTSPSWVVAKKAEEV